MDNFAFKVFVFGFEATWLDKIIKGIISLIENHLKTIIMIISIILSTVIYRGPLRPSIYNLLSRKILFCKNYTMIHCLPNK